MKNFMQLGLLAAALLPFPVDAQTTRSIPDVVRASSPAVVLLRTFDHNDKRVAVASGFVVTGGRVVTNSHVLEGAARVEIFSSDGDFLGTTQHAEAVNGFTDLAILPRLNQIPGALHLSVTLPEVGEQILAIGAPEGLANTVSDGIVSGFRTLGGRRLIQVTAPISQGSSGGPIINRSGEVVGVSVALLEHGQNLNFAVPASDVRNLLARAPTRVGLGSGAEQQVDSPGADVQRLGRRLINTGQTLKGVLEPGDFLDTDAVYNDVYMFSGRRRQKVSVTGRSPDFDIFIRVLYVDADTIVQLGEDDDGAGGTDASLTITLPADTEYSLVVSSWEAASVGNYTISIREEAATSPRGEVNRWIEIDPSTAFDRTRIVRVGNGVYRVWYRHTYQDGELLYLDRPIDTILGEKEIDCRSSNSRYISSAKYYRGEPVPTGPDEPAGPWRSAVPGTRGEQEIRSVCAYVRRNGL